MNYWLFAGGSVSVLTAAVHSILGELLIFRHLRGTSIVSNLAMPPLPPRRTGILWATWHIASVFGIAFSAVLFAVAFHLSSRQLAITTLAAIAVGNLGASALVLVGTRGRHPGWVALLAVAALIGIALLLD